MPRRVAQSTMALVMVATRPLLVDPVVAVAAEALEGTPRTRARASVRRARAASASDRVGLAVEALEGGPVRVDALDEVAPGDRGVGQVLGADPAAQAETDCCGSSCGDTSPRGRPSGHMPSAIWSALRWWGRGRRGRWRGLRGLGVPPPVGNPTSCRRPRMLMASGCSDSESAAADGVATEATTEAGTVSATSSTKV